MLMVTFPFPGPCGHIKAQCPAPACDNSETITKWPAEVSVETDNSYPDPLPNSVFFFFKIISQETFNTQTPILGISF